MEHRYPVIVLMVGIAFILSNSVLDDGLSHFGLFLVIVVGIALLLDIIRQRRSAGRYRPQCHKMRQRLAHEALA